MSRQKAITEEAKFHRSRKAKRLAGTLKKTMFDTPEFLFAERNVLLEEKRVQKYVKRHMAKYDARSKNVKAE